MDAVRAVDPMPSGERLSERDRAILEFERQWWKYAGAKETAVRDKFDMSSTRYYQVLNALIARGLSRDKAYALVQRNALRSWKEGKSFLELLEADPENPLKGKELRALFDPKPFLRHVDAIYARFGL